MDIEKKKLLGAISELDSFDSITIWIDQCRLMNNRIRYPLVFQESWLNKSIQKSINRDICYTNPIIEKNFIDSKNVKVTPILRIFKFLKSTDSNCLTAILTDSTHKILAIFPFYPTIVNFETKYKQRITYHTVNCLILVKHANLKFVNRFELEDDFEIRMNDDIDIAILEILDLEIFQRDQILLGNSVQNSLKFIYNDEEYIKVCGSDYKNVPKSSNVNKIILNDYDDVVSM